MNIYAAGSSPRTWGTQPGTPSLPSSSRFIPTHVGNTSLRRKIGRDVSVHPHARGEHNDNVEAWIHCSGSSPRTWGTRGAALYMSYFCRFIPTHVGNTSSASDQSQTWPVHPHARGEHHPGATMPTTRLGSSPRTWGTPATDVTTDIIFRFIPTHVGNTSVAPKTELFWPVHPHARGEHEPVAGISGHGTGSSPRTWGTLSGCRG